MNKDRKEQLNEKLNQIYKHGAGRTEGVIDDLLQEQFLGHNYYIHAIKETILNPPCEDYDHEDKDFTIIEIGLYQEGNSCIETFKVPVSTIKLHQIAARIDMAYYRWMKREPMSLRTQYPYEYYRDLCKCTLKSEIMFVEEAFFKLSKKDREKVISGVEVAAFLPNGGHE